MSTEKQKSAARKNIKKAQAARKTKSKSRPSSRTTLSTAQKDDLPDSQFAFARARKEPLTDARHVRNAVSRFDQVEGVTDAERDTAWRKITRAAKKFDVEITESDWRELFRGARPKKKAKARTKPTQKR
jgi:hypothetical protein